MRCGRLGRRCSAAGAWHGDRQKPVSESLSDRCTAALAPPARRTVTVEGVTVKKPPPGGIRTCRGPLETRNAQYTHAEHPLGAGAVFFRAWLSLSQRRPAFDECRDPRYFPSPFPAHGS